MSENAKKKWADALKSRGRQPRVRNARRTTVGRITFDSAREARRYEELLAMHEAGEISRPLRQVPFDLDTPTETGKESRYFADFLYVQADGIIFAEDVKGHKTEIYKRKVARFKELYCDRSPPLVDMFLEV